MALLDGDEIACEVQEEVGIGVLSVPSVPKEIATWAQTVEDVPFQLPSHFPYKSLDCQYLVANGIPSDDDVFRSTLNEDLIRFITKESHVNAMSESYMATLREDSHFIASQPSLHRSITNGMDGIVDNGAYESRLLLSTYLQEVNVIFNILGVGNLEKQENLFNNWADFKDAAAKFKVSKSDNKRFKYFVEVQRRSRAISLAKELAKGGKPNEVEVDFLRRNNELFCILHNNLEALFVIDDLLFRAKFLMKGENHQFCLVLENSDAERKMISLHSIEHRGHIYLYALFCRDYYTPNSLQMAYDVTSRCPSCVQMKAKKQTDCSCPNLSSEFMNRWAIDMKGPILIGSTKHYVLCGVELNLRLVHFSFAKSLEAKENAKLICYGIIASYGSSIKIISDRGKSFLNSKSTFYHPVLEMPEETMAYDKFWEERVRKFQALTKCLRDC